MRWSLRNRRNSLESLTPRDPIPDEIVTAKGAFRISCESLPHGKSSGMEMLTVDTGAIKVALLPDRGMGIWKCEAHGTEFGWQSPVDGPVHPAYVPIDDPTGIGWLEGFDELLVRCGLQSMGAPEFHPNGNVKFPLHGRIANLPATHLEVVVDAEQGTMDIVGTIIESRFLIYSLALQCRYRFYAGSSAIEIVDTVTNPLCTPVSMQLLYHINMGQPIVQAGSTVHAAYKSLCPRDARAAEGIADWNRCEGPTAGYAEQVYFMAANSDSNQWSESMICTEDRTKGLSVQFDTRTLPYLNLWKNTAAIENGYVVGLEPATGFPNPRGFEERNQRVITLSGGESRVFRMKLLPMVNITEVEQAEARIHTMRSDSAIVHTTPQPGWCHR